METMNLVRSRSGGGSWAEWEADWDDIISVVSTRAAAQRSSHPGFDVIRVLIEKHVVVRSAVTVEDGKQAGWADAIAPPGDTPCPS